MGVAREQSGVAAPRAFLALGSNLGDRLAHLQFAVDALAHDDGVRVTAISRVYETAPVGGPPQDAYLNAVVAVAPNLYRFRRENLDCSLRWCSETDPPRWR